MSDFKDMMVRDVTFTYPRLDSAYLYNSVERKSEKCSTTTPQAAWSCGFTVSKEEAVRIWGDAKDHYNECKSRSKDSKMGDFSTVHSYKQKRRRHDNLWHQKEMHVIQRHTEVKKCASLMDKRKT